jgi:hypothetical protein
MRLTFSYAGERILLTDAEQIAMFVPPGDSLEPAGEQSGFWLELRDRDERVVFRQLMHHPIETTREVFPVDPHGEFTHAPVASPRGVFSVIIPELAAARTLALVGSPADVRRQCEAARELVRFDLESVRKGKYRP